MSRRRSKAESRTYNPEGELRRIERTCTRKKQYKTEEDAQFEADIRYIDYYQCPFCGAYHLTSKKKKENVV